MSESAQEKMAQAFQNQQAQWSAFANKALDSSMKLFELNLKMAKQSLEDTTHSARHLLSAKSPEELFAFDQELVQGRVHQAMAYASEINAIASAFTNEMTHAAQGQFNHSPAAQVVEEVNHSLPMQKFFPQMGEMNQGFEHWMDAGKKIAEAFGQSLPIQMPSAMSVPVTRAAPAKRTVAKPAPAGRSRAR
ncbi:phasin family protein [Oxalobacteraceae bacterium GrIS 2.11]